MSTRSKSDEQEQYVANYLDGEVTPNSGAGHTKKGDVLVDKFYLVECKTKMQPTTQFTIKKEWLILTIPFTFRGRLLFNFFKS